MSSAEHAGKRSAQRIRMTREIASRASRVRESATVVRARAARREFSLDGACTNQAVEYFSRLRRAEIGIHHHIAGAYLLRYAQESSWREDNCRVSNGDKVSRIA
jgi:hypothetical protein